MQYAGSEKGLVNCNVVVTSYYVDKIRDFPVNPFSYKAIVENPELLKDGCWAYCDVRDIAQAFRLMVEAKGLKKYEVFCICAKDNVTKTDSVELVRKYWSERIPFKKS